MTKFQPKKYVRKPFEIEAVQVTEENFDDVAKWCKGNKQTLNDGTPYIKVKVFKPMGDRQTEAHIGDWVLFFNGGFKVYLDPSFSRSFEEVNNGGTFNQVMENAKPAPPKAKDVPTTSTETVEDGVRTITSARLESVNLVAGADPAQGVHPIEVLPGNAMSPGPHNVPVENLRFD